MNNVKKYEIEIEKIKNFSLKDIFENGQAFRWKKLDEDGKIYLTIYNKYVLILEEKNGNNVSEYTDLKILVYTKSEENVDKIKEKISHYLDLDFDYENVRKEILKKEKSVEESLEYGKGIRILNQEKIEVIISFIISANNNIPRIKKSIEKISQKAGEKIEFEYAGEKYTEYLFPELTELIKLKEEDYKEAGTGFRAKRLEDTCKMIFEGHIENIESLEDDLLEEKLLQLAGVGPKVANCITLFGYHKMESFPIDVWVKRVMTEEFFKGKTEDEVSNKQIMERVKDIPYKGLMQQYLFYWRRERR